MAETRILRERKKAVNYNEAGEQPHGQRKLTDLVGDARRSTRNNKLASGTDKENRKKRERPASRSLHEADSGGSGDSNADSDGPSHKRARSPVRNDGSGRGNVFVAFARPGRQPAGKLQARPSRAAAARASRRITDAATKHAPGADDGDDDDDEEDEGEDYAPVAGGRRSGRPTRNAAATAKGRLRRGAAGAHALGSSEEDDQDSSDTEEEEGEGVEGGGWGIRGSDAAGMGKKRGARREAAGALLVDDSSGSASGDEDEEMEGVAKAIVRKGTLANGAGAGRGGRPTRKCVERAAARAAGAANILKDMRRQAALDSKEDDGLVVVDVRKKGVAAAAVHGGSSRRAPARGKTASNNEDDEEEEEEDDQEGTDGVSGGISDSEDLDVQLVRDDQDEEMDGGEDESEGDSSSDGEVKDDGEEPVKCGRGRPRKGKAKAAAPAKRGRGRPRKNETAKAAGDDDDEEAKNSTDDSTGDDISDGEEKDDEEPGKHGRGRPSRGAPKATAPVKRGRGRHRKDEAAKSTAASTKGTKATATAAAGNGGGRGKPREPVEKILSYDSEKETYLVKLEGVSYRRTAHMSLAHLNATKPLLLRFFLNRGQPVEVDPDWLKVDRVIASRTVSRGRSGSARQLLVKWRGLEYSDSTWEYEDDLASKEDKAAIARFKRLNSTAGPASAAGTSGGNPAALRQPDFELPAFRNGRSLRDYQEVSVRWMVNNYSQRRNCILGDEMGLGKTAQSISTLQTLRVVGGVPGPFLVVAPLSTLGHWQREIETWTDMNVVHLAGSAADRALIVEHEFYRSSSGGSSGRGGRGREVKFNVLLVSYDMLLKERLTLRAVSWSAAVFDEAHRLKGLNSSTRAVVEDMDIDWMLLLTGTPVQNNMLELYSILSLLDPEGYPSPENFTSRFGGAPGGPPPTVEQIRALQAALAPVLLRRMKEDVEELPQKEEVVVWVELTAAQRAYYRAMYEGQIGALLGGASSKNLPSMRNLAMELRKLCCHPVLCDGLEDDLKLKLATQRSLAPADAPQEFSCPELELLVRGSGKMVLLHKLLHKLRAEGRRVLIFSQFVIMLNVLEDYCNAVGFPVERIDGNVRGRDRQQAIDRFCAEGDGSQAAFVFLLSTRAGGQGITLTAADTCIIYDSDWNPQNDLQAMARCHRIGQKKEVTVYRLISRDTYEMALFNSASRKYGLDEAILGFSGGSDPESDSARIADLLRHGAHGLLSDMEAGARRGEAFASEDINQILAGRTEKRQIGSRAGNTFSVATFAADDGLAAARAGRRKRARAEDSHDDDDQPADEDYWRALMPEAVAAHESKATEVPEVLGPRKRKHVNYNMNHKTYNPKVDSDDSSSDDSDDNTSTGGDTREEAKDGAEAQEGAGSEGGEAAGKKRRGRPKKARDGSAEVSEGQQAADGGAGQGQRRGRKPIPKLPAWTKTGLRVLEDRITALGPDRWADVYEQLQPTKFSAEEVETAGRAMWELYGIASRLGTERDAAKRKADGERMAAAFAAPMLSLTDEDSPSLLRVNVAGAGNTAAAAAATKPPAAAAPPPPPPINALDEYEEKLAKVIPETVPKSLHIALSGRQPLRRLLKESTDILQHGKLMAELSKLMRPAAAGGAAAHTETAASGASVSPGAATSLRPPLLAPPLGSYLRWWGREEDEALLRAAVQVGYAPSKPGRTVEHALRNPPLVGRVVALVDPLPGQESGKEQPEDGDAGVTESGAAAALPPAKPADADGDQEMAGAVDQQRAAPPQLRAPGPNGPLQLSSSEWRVMVGVLARRLKGLVKATVDNHRRAAGVSRQPLAMVRPSRPSGPPSPSREAAIAAGTGASRPQSGAAPAAAAAAAPVGVRTAHAVALVVQAAVKAAPAIAAVAPKTAPTVVAAVPAAARPAPAVAAVAAAGDARAPSTLAGMMNIVAATVAAAARRVSGGELSPLKAAAGAAKTSSQPKPKTPQLIISPLVAQACAVQQAVGDAAVPQGQVKQQPQAHSQPQAQLQPQQRPADPHRHVSGDVNQLRHHDKPSAAAGGAGRSSGLKQSILPFARMSNNGPAKSSAAPAAAATTPTPVAAGTATAAEEAGASPKSPQLTKAAVVVRSTHRVQPLVAGKRKAGSPSGRTAPGSAEKPIEIDDSD